MAIKLCKCGCGKEVKKHYSAYAENHGINKRGFAVYGNPNKGKYTKFRPCKCGCNQHVYNFDRVYCDGHKKNTKKGKTFEQIFGEEKAKEMKLLINKSREGKTLEEFYGEKRAKQIKEKKGVPSDMIIKAFQDEVDRNGIFSKNEWGKRVLICDAQTVRNKFGSLDKLAEYAGRCFAIPDTTKWFRPPDKVGKIEKIAREEYIKNNPNNAVIPQFKIKSPSKTGYYKIDWFDATKNIAFEFDEPHHNYQKVFDAMRQEHIQKVLGCEFMRIKQTDWLQLQDEKQTNLAQMMGEDNE